jgi:uncharacterized membrane protein
VLAPSEESSTGLSPRAGALLAYSAWWVTGLVFWWLERRNPYIRFHAAQSVAAFGTIAAIIAAFGALAVLSLAVLPGGFAPFLWAAGLAWGGGTALWLFALWAVATRRRGRLPLFAALADRMAGAP